MYFTSEVLGREFPPLTPQTNNTIFSFLIEQTHDSRQLKKVCTIPKKNFGSKFFLPQARGLTNIVVCFNRVVNLEKKKYSTRKS